MVPRSASDPSPGPLRLMKAPAAVHPLPTGEGRALAGNVHPISRSIILPVRAGGWRHKARPPTLMPEAP